MSAPPRTLVRAGVVTARTSSSVCDDDLCGGTTSDSDEESPRSAQRRKRRRQATSTDATPKGGTSDIDSGENEHLFFRLGTASDEGDGIAVVAAPLVIHGFASLCHEDAATAATIRDESHMVLLTLRSRHESGQLATIRVDRHDVRLLLDQAEWQPPRRHDRDGDEDEEVNDEGEISGNTSGDDQTDLCDREHLTAAEWHNLQYERYRVDDDCRDADESAARDSTADSPSSDPLMAPVTDRVTSVDQAVNSVVEETARRAPPPPPRKRPPPPPPPRTVDAAATTIATAEPAAPPEETPFLPAFAVPHGMVVPLTTTDHRVIAHTVQYINSLGAQGGQQEIFIKLKQQNNAAFYFLNYDHPLHPYYTWCKTHPEHATQTTTPSPTEAEPAASPCPPSSALQATPTTPPACSPPPGIKAPPGIRRLPTGPPGVALPVRASTSTTLSDVSNAPSEQTTAANPLVGLIGGYDEDEEGDGDAATKQNPPASTAPPSIVGHFSSTDPPQSQSSLTPTPAAISSDLPLSAHWLSLLPAPPHPLPPVNVRAVIDTLCHRLFLHGSAFELLTRARERNNPQFAFLHASHASHAYFQWRRAIQPIIESEQKASSDAKAKETTVRPAAESAIPETVESHPPPAPHTDRDSASDAADRMIAEAKLQLLTKMRQIPP